MSDKNIPKVNSTGINQSLTDWGGKNAGGKAKAVLKDDLKVDRNVNKDSKSR